MADLKYSKSHEWIAEEDGLCVIGISDYAQHSLGDIVFINLPEVDDEVTVGDAFGDIESVKAVSDVLSLLQESLRRSTRAYLMHLRQSTRIHTALG